MLYKVVKEEGVVVDGVEFSKDEVLDLAPDAFNVPALLEEGAIVETDEKSEDGDDEGEGEPESTPEVPVAPALTFNGKKVVGEVSDVETEGVLYKTFTVEGGETFKLPVAEFEEGVVRE